MLRNIRLFAKVSLGRWPLTLRSSLITPIPLSIQRYARRESLNLKDLTMLRNIRLFAKVSLGRWPLTLRSSLITPIRCLARKPK